ncbi:hypothetical protein R3P38DRAFT_3226290 [Favolaschia claudopus]|uniref:Uncharacterized protein n=1 Tax=Favolaschia claudopus TaxID=2862362 RepID=A0AAV9ZTX7_9AGAR
MVPVLRSRSEPVIAYPLARKAGYRGLKSDMRAENQRDISGILRTLAGSPPPALPTRHQGHYLTRPRLNTGTTDVGSSGEYYQIVRGVLYPRPTCRLFHAISQPLNPRILRLEGVRELFLVRRELAPIPRNIRPLPSPQACAAPSKTKARVYKMSTRGTPPVRPLQAVPNQASSSRSSNSPAQMGFALDMEFPLRLLIWTKTSAGPNVIDGVYAGADKKFRLDCYMPLLEKQGITQPWERKAPIPVFQSDEVIVIRTAGLSSLVEWDDYKDFIY